MASVAAVVVVAAAVGALVGGFPDLHVYRYAGRSVLDQWPAYRYDDPVTGYPLTYPPFAALLMVMNLAVDLVYALLDPRVRASLNLTATGEDVAKKIGIGGDVPSRSQSPQGEAAI